MTHRFPASNPEGFLPSHQLKDEQRIQINRISDEEVRETVRGMVDALAGIGNVGRPEGSGVRSEPGGRENGEGGQIYEPELLSRPSISIPGQPGKDHETGSVDGNRDGGTQPQPARVGTGTIPVGEGAGTRGSSLPSGDPAGTVRIPVEESPARFRPLTRGKTPPDPSGRLSGQLRRSSAPFVCHGLPMWRTVSGTPENLQMGKEICCQPKGQMAASIQPNGR